MLRVAWRISAMIVILLAMGAFALLGRLLIPSPRLRRRFAARNLSRTCRAANRVLGIRVRVEHEERIPASRRCLIVANHLSWIDVLVISSRMPALFVTSVEVEQSAVLGWICKAGGSFFVERRNRTRLAAELAELSGALKDGECHLVVFPEATSSDGETLLPFKNALFDSAVRSESPVLPLCLRYQKVDGAPLDRSNRDSVFYYGDMTFLEQFRRFIRVGRTDVLLTVLEPMGIGPDTTRKDLAEKSRAMIIAAYGQPFA